MRVRGRSCARASPPACPRGTSRLQTVSETKTVPLTAALMGCVPLRRFAKSRDAGVDLDDAVHPTVLSIGVEEAGVVG